MADSSPYMVLSVDSSWGYFKRKGTGAYRGGTDEKERFGNSPNHKGDGQNVLYNDCHVSFSDVPYCGFDEDNIYTASNIEGKTEVVPDIGGIPTVTAGGVTRCFAPIGSIRPFTKIDSLLINEGIDQGGVDKTGAGPGG